MPRKGKCFSTCRKRPKSECDHPECHYTNGNKYKYCRLSFTRKMNEDCVPVLRKQNSITKKQVDQTRKRKHGPFHKQKKSLLIFSPRYEKYSAPPEKQILNLHPKKEDIESFRLKYVKNTATRKIGRFLRRTDPRVRSKFLQSVCSDAGVCIAFGTNAAAIRKHFDEFDNFNLLSKPATQIGSVSANGFVKELTYMNRGYMANAVLKSSVQMNADNLLYEALVGFFLNKVSTIYPTFVETYGLYQYNADGLAYNECKGNKLTNPSVLTAGLKRIAKSTKDIDNLTVKTACLSPTSMAVLIQHLKSAKTLHEMLFNSRFVKNELLYILFQVYATLASMQDVFTHYDLHFENVLVYEPVIGEHIEYHYYYAGEDSHKKAIFKSKYIAKIIDYGRCYFNDKSSTRNTNESKKFYDNLLCKECKPYCGSGKGYGWFKPDNMPNAGFICSQRLNPSHDLRLLYTIGYGSRDGMDPILKTLMKKVVYGKRVIPNFKQFGTEPNPVSGIPLKINNVTDAADALSELVIQPHFVEMNNDAYSGSKKLGELHIYGDGKTPMKWIPGK